MQRGFDYIGTVVVFVCHDGRGRILLQKRSKTCRDEQGTWDCGGGGLEFGETFEDAIRREVREEYCAEPIEIRQCAVHNVLRENDGRKSHWVAITHAVRVDPATIAIGDPDKIDEIGWFTLDALPTPLHSTVGKDFDAVRAAGIL